jgi:pilus assembly protein Flp/PilA
MSKIVKFIRKIRKDQAGATAIEYGLIAALIAVVIIITVGAAGNNVNATFSKISTRVASANTQGR